MARWLTPLLVALIVLLQYSLWLGDGGWFKIWSQSREVERQAVLNAQLRERNDTLSAEVKDLKEARDAIEERARSELGMVRPDEVFVRVVPGKSTSEQAKP
jgi:cell division protein FtsB